MARQVLGERRTQFLLIAVEVCRVKQAVSSAQSFVDDRRDILEVEAISSD